MGVNLASVPSSETSAEPSSETSWDDTYNEKSYWSRAIVMPSPNLKKYEGYFEKPAKRDTESESTEKEGKQGRTDSDDYSRNIDRYTRKNSINVYLLARDQFEISIPRTYCFTIPERKLIPDVDYGQFYLAYLQNIRFLDKEFLTVRHQVTIQPTKVVL